MNPEPRYESDYTQRQVDAARRVLIDVGQVLASFRDCMVIIGGWIPDLLIPNAGESHSGSIDVDIALDAAKLNDGRYADLVKLLLETRRYRAGTQKFQFVTEVDLKDGNPPVQVEVEFLAPQAIKLKKHSPKLLAGFRVLQADGCGAAFRAPVDQSLSGRNVSGAQNTVKLRLASIADFLVMKAYALGGREKPKDAYDICFCLEHNPAGMEPLATDWKTRGTDPDVIKARAILREKFTSVDDFGPQQVVEFHNASDTETRAMQARRAYELVQRFLHLLV
jgi:hypothetical protein